MAKQAVGCAAANDQGQYEMEVRPIINKIIGIALEEEGYLEKKSNAQLEDKTANAGMNNYTKYGAWWAGGALQAQPWCAMFLSWCADRAGIPADIFYPHAYCPYGVTWYKNKGLWHGPSGYTPRRGDVIYFTSNGTSACHVGLVYGVDKSKVYTIEGNTNVGNALEANGGGVALKSYALSYSKILGYASPKYINYGVRPIPEEEEMTYEQFKDYIARYEAEQRDKPASKWAQEDWKTATELKLFDGTMPQAPLTREQAATVIGRVLGRGE